MNNNLFRTNSNFFQKNISNYNNNNSENMKKTFYSNSRIKTGKSQDKNYYKNLPLMNKSTNHFNKSEHIKRWSSTSKDNNNYIKKKNNNLWNSNYIDKDVFLKILNSFEKKIS